MPSYKAGRMAEDIRRIVFGKMRELKDPRIGGGEMLTVTRCEVSSDGSYCKVYISGFGGEKQTADAVKGLTSATGIFKREISNVLGLRKCPDLKFSVSSIYPTCRTARIIRTRRIWDSWIR